jgi:phenylacetic acid degradation operon negative regulatory protein
VTARRSERPGSRSLILDLYGAYVRDLGGWIAVADLVRLMGDLGIDEQVVRSSVSRMLRNGLLERDIRDGTVGYLLSPRAARILEEGDERIFAGSRPARLDDGWVIAVFSIPEHNRPARHQLRSRLTWLGMGRLDGGVWIAPWRVRDDVQSAVTDLALTGHVDLFHARYDAFGTLRELAERCWDLADLNERYGGFVRRVAPLLGQWRQGQRSGQQQAFADYTTALHEWRKMPYLDPGLPLEMLPADWKGSRAAELFAELVAEFHQQSRDYVKSVMFA